VCTPTSSLDVVVRVGPNIDDQLRYTLRSLSLNLPHARILTAGCRPLWTTCEHIDVPPVGGKFAHAYAVLRAILEADRLTDAVVIADDDMYLMRPLEVLPEYHCGPLERIRATPSRRQGLADTLAATPDTLCRDLHVPTLIDRASLLDKLDALDLPHARRTRVWWRTLSRGGCTPIRDAKVRQPWEPVHEGDWISSSDRSWGGNVGRYVRGAFPEPCAWETGRAA
jgi:hypothetical protein